MKKLILLAMILFLAVGCGRKSSKEDVLLDKYKTAYSSLVGNDKFETTSLYYDIEVVVNEIENGQYRIDTIIDNPKVAMYNVQVIMEINSTGVEQYEDVVPSIGIVDQSFYHLIPFQVNKEEGFYEGLVVSGISDLAAGEVIVEVTWTNYAETESYDEFIKLTYDIDLEDEELESEDE